jgi:hypothetical protein
MLSVVMLGVIMLSVVMLGVIMLSVVMVGVIMLIVMSPILKRRKRDLLSMLLKTLLFVNIAQEM